MKIQPITPQQAQRYQWLGYFLGYHASVFVTGVLMVSLIYPISQAVLVPWASLIMPIPTGSLLKTLSIYTLVFWAVASFKGIKGWQAQAQLCNISLKSKH
jgi:hypothetical protein